MWQASELEQRINKIMDRAVGDDHGKRACLSALGHKPDDLPARAGLVQAKQDA
jgi:hypothetical protein